MTETDNHQLDDQTITPNASGIWFSQYVQFGLMLFFVFHVIAIVAEPYRFFTQTERQSAAPEIQPVRDSLAPYVEFLFLNHGYFFFAPNPGPSHLVVCGVPEYQMENSDSDNNAPQIRAIATLPDRNVHFPRLYYHRHFMYSEFFHNVSVPLDILDDIPPDSEYRQSAEQQLIVYNQMRKSIQRRLAVQFPDLSDDPERLIIRRVEHAMPGIDEFFRKEDPIALTDPRLYETLDEQITADASNDSESIESIAAEEIPIQSNSKSITANSIQPNTPAPPEQTDSRDRFYERSNIPIEFGPSRQEDQP